MSREKSTNPHIPSWSAFLFICLFFREEETGPGFREEETGPGLPSSVDSLEQVERVAVGGRGEDRKQKQKKPWINVNDIYLQHMKLQSYFWWMENTTLNSKEINS